MPAKRSDLRQDFFGGPVEEVRILQPERYLDFLVGVEAISGINPCNE